MIVQIPNRLRYMPKIRRIQSGKIYTVPFYERNGQFSFELSEKTTQVFVRIECYSFLDFKIISIDKKKSFNLEKKNSLFYGLSLGVLILIFLYHLILFQIVKEQSYLFFGIQSGVSLLYILLNSGFLVDNIHPSIRDFAAILLNISLLLLLIGLLRIKSLNKSLYVRLLYLIPGIHYHWTNL